MNIKGIIKAYPIAFAAAATLMLFSGLATYRNAVLADLKEDLTSKDNEASKLSENLHNAQKLDAQLNQMADLNRRVAARLSIQNDVASNQQYFYKMEAETGVKLLDLHPVNSAVRASKKNALTQYSTIAYSVSLQGDYTHLLTFLRSFESGSRISIITQADISPVAGARPTEDANSAAPLLMNLDVQLLGVL